MNTNSDANASTRADTKSCSKPLPEGKQVELIDFTQSGDKKEYKVETLTLKVRLYIFEWM